jgi:hypothetical protein
VKTSRFRVAPEVAELIGLMMAATKTTDAEAREAIRERIGGDLAADQGEEQAEV